MKLNIGSNNVRVEGYFNLDVLQLPNVDAICDLSETPYKFKLNSNNFEDFVGLKEAEESFFTFDDNTIDGIISLEFLEHIPFRKTFPVLKEWYRILRKNGTVSLQVPDAGKAMEYYINNEVCDCVPHKGYGNANPNCFKCEGKAKINSIRWLYTFTGAQKHEYDTHLNIFTKDILFERLKKIGFRDIEFEDDPYKLKVHFIK